MKDTPNILRREILTKGMMPVSLFYYSDGSLDLHCQTGPTHMEDIDQAAAILRERDLIVRKAEFYGPSGMYYPVIKKKQPPRADNPKGAETR